MAQQDNWWEGSPVVGGSPAGGTFIPAPGAARQEQRAEESLDVQQAQLGLAGQNQARSGREEVRGAAQELRDAFEKQKPVQDYQVALPAYSGILDLASKSPSKANDFTIITLFNKIQDPGSAVLEGERTAAQNASTYFEKYKTQLQGLFDPEAGFVSDDARRQFVQTAQSLITERNRAYNAMRDRYTQIAQAPEYGVNPDIVVGQHYGQTFVPELTERWGKIFPQKAAQEDGGLTDGGDEGPPPGQVLLYMGKNEDGSEYPVYGTTEDKAALEMEGTPGLGTLAKHGAMFGLSDEAAGVGGAIAGLITGKDPIAEYERNNALADLQIERARENTGWLGTGAELLGGGGGALGKITAAAPTVMGALAEGAGAGALSGFGYGEGAADSLKQAAIGGTVGGALGAALPGVVQAVRGARTPAVTPVELAEEGASLASRMSGAVPEAPAAPATPAPTAAPIPAGTTVRSGDAGAARASEETIRAERARELPVPIELAKFQRSRLFEEQQRARELAKNNEIGAPIRQRLTEQQTALRQNFDKFIDETGSEVWENAREKGIVVDEALKKLASVGKARVRTLYNRAVKAGETQEPVSYQQLAEFVGQQTPTTREQLAPVLKAVEEQLAKNDPGGTGAIPINALEDVRKLINKVAQPGTPNEAYGREMKGIIDGLTEGKGGDLYKAARQARIDYANTFENAGLVKQLMGTKPGTVDRQVALENVAEKAIYSGGTSLDDIKALKGVLDKAGTRGDRAWRELQGATLEHIRDAAYRGITKDEAGNVVVSPVALNKAITALDRNGKLEFVFGTKTAELLRTMNEVSQDLFTAPPGSVNASGTSGAMLNAIDTLATFGTTGLPIPAAKILNGFRQSIQNRGLRKEVKRLLD